MIKVIPANLMPCPFCGMEPELFLLDSGMYVVGCVCGCQSPKVLHTKKIVVDSWNTRAKHKKEKNG